MNTVDRIRIRFADALITTVFTIIVATLAGALTDTSIATNTALSSEGYTVVLSMKQLPLALTLCGLGAAIYRAGLFGLIGFPLESTGAITFFADASPSALGVVAVGAVLVTVGAFIWSWKPIIKAILQLRGRSPPPRPP